MYGALSYLSNLWDLEEQRRMGCFKVIIWDGNTNHKGGGTNLIGKAGFSLCNTAVLKLYCKSYWVL